MMQMIDLDKPRGKELSLSWLEKLEMRNVSVMALDPAHDQILINTLNSTSNWIIEFEDEDVVFYYRDRA